MIIEKFIHNGTPWVIVKLEYATHILPEKEWKWIEKRINKHKDCQYDDKLFDSIDFVVFDRFRSLESDVEEGVDFEL